MKNKIFLLVLTITIALLIYFINSVYERTDGLYLIKSSSQNTSLIIINVEDLKKSIPEGKKITNKDKSITETIDKESILESIEKSKTLNVQNMTSSANIYYLFTDVIIFTSLTILLIGLFIGHITKKPINNIYLKNTNKKNEEKIKFLEEETEKAKELAQNADKRALSKLEELTRSATQEKNKAIKDQEESMENVNKINNELEELKEELIKVNQSKTAALVMAKRRKTQIEKNEEKIKELKEKLSYYEENYG